LSARPWNFSGSGRRDLESSCTSVGATESWPRRVRSTVPVAPMKSPMSSSLTAAKAASPSTLMRQNSWMSPVPSRSTMKAALPWSRSAITRPATLATSSVDSPSGRSA